MMLPSKEHTDRKMKELTFIFPVAILNGILQLSLEVEALYHTPHLLFDLTRTVKKHILDANEKVENDKKSETT